ncbi:MAG: phosphate signaling complex protein PhoU [Thermodesulfobacteriota bacterium]
MAKRLRVELDKLKERILLLGSMVEENVRNGVKAFLSNDPVLAVQVQKKDDDIDRTEISVEEECLRILALHQPVAGDLRFVVTVLKVNNDLERIGDLASKIAKKLLFLKRENKDISLVNVPEELFDMNEKTLALLKNSLDAFVREDADLAYKVLIWDDEIDEAKAVIRRKLEEIQQQDPSQHVYLASLLSITRNLERIGDHATNIAEDVIYMMQGRIIRHDISEIS